MAGDAPTPAVDAADSVSFDLLKQRLTTEGAALAEQTRSLNEARLAAFGRSEQSLLLRTRARTENNCHARDIVRIGEQLLFGFNVFIGLRKETAVADVFALYRLGQGDELEALPLAGSFLDEARFTQDFRELYAYYKQATLTQLRVTADKLLASFKIGQQAHDLRVFRWQIGRDGGLQYIDNRGERDIALPPTHDFEWTLTTREQQVAGRHPHVNILDAVFVETTGGDLTVKVENNTETGLGVYSEPVEDKNQSLADAEIAYAKLGALILLRVRPYRETATRYLVFNTHTQQVERIDAIGASCVQLPEDHGLLFPGGCYLQSGELKRFDLPGEVTANLRFKRMVRSPNGEDVLFLFYEPASGHYALFTYNLIAKSLATPILANGYARYADGRVLVFQVETGEPTRVHPMQLWQTPFFSEEHALAQPKAGGFFGRIGNAELVRGIADLGGVARALAQQAPTRGAYEDLLRQCARINDAYFWLAEPEAGGLQQALTEIAAGARATLTEFEKVEAIRQDTVRAQARAEGEQRELLTVIASTLWRQPDDFIQALGRLRERRGQLQLLKVLRYADLPRLDAMDGELATEQRRVGEKAMQFLAGARAFDGQRLVLDQLATQLPQVASTTQLASLLEQLDGQASGLDLLTEQLGGLPGGDAVTRTQILDRISALYADINKLRAEARMRRKSMGASEAAAEFGAQFKLFGQALDNAVAFADTPEACDDALTRLLAQLEELEGRFSEHDAFLGDITSKREAVVEALSARRQSLVDARQRRSQSIQDAASRILDGLPRRLSKLPDPAQVHSLFAADPLLDKLRSLMADLRQLGAAVAADELATRLNTARDNALRKVRDQADLSRDNGKALRLGQHQFSVSQQALELTLVPRGEGMAFHLTGTDYFAPLVDAELTRLAPFWSLSLVSESPDLARAEYLAAQMLEAAQTGELQSLGLHPAELLAAALAGDEGHTVLLDAVRRYAAPRYQEGYQKGVHDEDAARLLAPLLRMQDSAGLLAFEPAARALAMRYWAGLQDPAATAALLRRARAAAQMERLFQARQPMQHLQAELAEALKGLEPAQADDAARAAAYLVRQLATHGEAPWPLAAAAADLLDALQRELSRSGQADTLRHDLEAAPVAERWHLARNWLQAYAAAQHPAALPWLDDAASALALPLTRERMGVSLETEVAGLLSEHPRIAQGQLRLNLNGFWRRYSQHRQVVQPAFEALQKRRLVLVQEEKARLRLTQFEAKPLSSFVRNRLIDEVYLPMVGDNLAKQLGASGDAARTDRMGLLLLISPPGYGKTTLMEYLAERLGLIFVRINCPALGHDITSVDPAAASHSAARQELEKLNLGLAMGNNVMLYLDDIQHTHPEFLQKFISLADGTRRMDGVWQGQAKSFDLRGKRFAIVMAGNPYTEGGEVFKIPDMLANRADIYNLGDVLTGRESLFGLSYIENCLTANAVLQPLASRDPTDVHKLVRLAEGEALASSAFSHPYSSAELEELRLLMQRLFKARDLLLKVNLAYIASAAQDDRYRLEPPFKLQGSYRNMGKLAAKITALMRDEELDALLRDHYRGEAQTLTQGAEENLLKLAHLLGRPAAQEQARWQEICEAYVRERKFGGEEGDGHTRIAASLLDVASAVKDLQLNPPATEGLRMADALLQLAVTYRKILMPLIDATERRLGLDQDLSAQIERLAGASEARGAGDPSAPDSPSR